MQSSTEYVQWSTSHRVHTEWQMPLSGVHSIMIQKLAQAGEGIGCTPTSFHYIFHHVQSCGVRPYFYYIPVLCSTSCPLYVCRKPFA
jgi:hypothetical protein